MRRLSLGSLANCEHGRVWLCAASLAAVTLFTGPASAQPRAIACAPQSEILTNLREKHGESPSSWRVRADGSLLVVAASPKTQTWTILHIEQGRTCVLGAGKDWDRILRTYAGIEI